MLTLLLADESGYLPIGRSQIRDGALAVYWPNSGFSIRFKARSAIVSFKPFSSGAPLYLKAFLDGKATKHTVATGDEKLLFESLDDGEHTLTLLRVSESIDALRIESVTLLGENAAFLDPPAERSGASNSSAIPSPAATACWPSRRSPATPPTSRTARWPTRI